LLLVCFHNLTLESLVEPKMRLDRQDKVVCKSTSKQKDGIGLWPFLGGKVGGSWQSLEVPGKA
jgi:hypothetical protein